MFGQVGFVAFGRLQVRSYQARLRQRVKQPLERHFCEADLVVVLRWLSFYTSEGHLSCVTEAAWLPVTRPQENLCRPYINLMRDSKINEQIIKQFYGR